MGHGHAVDATNRLKSNNALRTKAYPFSLFKDQTKPPPSQVRYHFKTPTAKELKRLEAKNRIFLENQKKVNLVLLIFAFAVGFALLYGVCQTEVWAAYVGGLGKYTTG